MPLKLSNNATTSLIAPLSAASTVAMVLSTQAFPALGALDYCYVTLVSLMGGSDTYGNPLVFEIVKVTGPLVPGAGNNITIVRAQDGTNATAFVAGDVVDERVCRAVLTDSSVSGALLAVNNLSDVANAATSFTNLNFLTSLAGGVARSARAKGMDILSVKDFGAKGDGATDDTAALNAAMAAANTAGKMLVYFPPGNYLTSTGITLNNNGVCVSGASAGASIITVTANNVPGIAVLGANWTGLSVTNLTVLRSVVAVANGDGIQWAITGATKIAEGGYIANVVCTGHAIGFNLGCTSFSTIENCISNNNLSHGFAFVNGGNPYPLQWVVHSCLSQTNVGNGFHVFATGNTQATMGTMTKLFTFANSGRGFFAQGTVTSPVQGLRIFQCFFGQDGTHEITLDTFGAHHQIGQCYLELAGTSPTGPGLATPATNNAYGSTFTVNNTDINVSGCVYSGNSFSQIFNQCPSLLVGNSTFAAYGGGVSVPPIPSQQSAIANFVGGYVQVVGCKMVGGSASSLYGIYTEVDGLIVTGCDMRGNVTAPYFTTIGTGALQTTVFSGCLPAFANAPALIASAASIALPTWGDVINVTGATNISSITGGWNGRRITLLVFTGFTFIHGTGANNMELNGNVNFVAAANATLSLVLDNGVWFETGRKA